MFLREKNGRSLLASIVNNSDELLVLTDDDGNNYEFKKVWYKPYRSVTYCLLCNNILIDGKTFLYVFKFTKVNKELLLCYETNMASCLTILNDYNKNFSEYFSGCHNIVFGNIHRNKLLTDNDSLNESRVYATTSETAIKPSMSLKGRKSVMAILITSYLLLLLAGVLFAAIPKFSSVFVTMGICEDISASAYSITIGLMWIALVPSLGYYFAAIPPYDISKKVKTALAIITTFLTVAMLAVFFAVIYTLKIDTIIPEIKVPINEFYEDDDTWFIPVSMAFASLGMIICYTLTLFKIKPDKIKDIKPQKKGEGLFAVIKYGFVSICSLILKLSKAILKFKEKQPELFILFFSILLTWLVFFTAFIFSIICIAVLVSAIIMYFAGVLHLANDNKSTTKIVEINDCGTTKILTHNPYIVEDRFEEVYEEGNGTRWYSKDGGKTVYKK